jgi:hypothetical protein
VQQPGSPLPRCCVATSHLHARCTCWQHERRGDIRVGGCVCNACRGAGCLGPSEHARWRELKSGVTGRSCGGAFTSPSIPPSAPASRTTSRTRPTRVASGPFSRHFCDSTALPRCSSPPLPLESGILCHTRSLRAHQLIAHVLLYADGARGSVRVVLYSPPLSASHTVTRPLRKTPFIIK